MGRPKGALNKKSPNNTNYICGNTIYYHRIAHGMSQFDMAEKIGISARTLQRMENDPNFSTTRGTAYKVAYEITFNPALANPEVIKLMDKWNMENEKKTSKTFLPYGRR